MPAYTVRQVAKMAGVSVRTLHHYDHIGLLRPATRTEAGYRLYEEADLLRLQQILFFKVLGFSLADIERILDDPGFDQVEALQHHRRRLQQRSQQLAQLLKTIDKTIAKLTEDKLMTDEELYEGFTPEQIERYQREVNERYDPELVRISKERLGKMNKAQWQALKTEGETVTRLLAQVADHSPDDPAVQQLIARHHAMIEQFYPASAELYRGLGQLYVEHDEFRAHYEQFRPGLADFMRAAMVHYADHVLAQQ
ncbi:MAG: MerR family transcriptional regulator [Anaerolineae bacterium]|nr:MerR family transcriptional regulator [Anaerolineae bacterium]